MTWRGRITATVLALGVLAYAGGASALADAYFEVHTFVEWEDALLTGNVVPISPVNWDIYMDEWAMYTEEGDPYPPNEFRPATLYAYEGPDFERAGLVMAWGEDDPPAGDYATAWEWDYLVDPDLSNAVVTMTVYPPSYLGGGGDHADFVRHPRHQRQQPLVALERPRHDPVGRRHAGHG